MITVLRDALLGRRAAVGQNSRADSCRSPRWCRCPILSATRPCTRSGRPPWPMCPGCSTPSVAGAEPAVDVACRDATGKRSWYCAGCSTPPGSAISQSTTRAAPRRLTATYTGPSTCRPPLRRPAGSAARGPRRRADPYDLDGTLIHTDRSKAVGPTGRLDLSVVGHAPPSRRVQVVTARTDGLCGRLRCDRPRTRHHLRPHPSGPLDALTDWTDGPRRKHSAAG